MTKLIGIEISYLAFAAVPVFAQNPVTPFTDSEGVPKRQYLIIKTCYGGIDCKGTCDIENTQDRSTISCSDWFSRYCPAASNNVNCKALDEDVGIAIERD